MPRYFFHVFNGLELPDLQGSELPSNEAARARAIKEANDFAAETLAEHGHLVRTHRIEIADAKGTIIDTITFGDAVKSR